MTKYFYIIASTLLLFGNGGLYADEVKIPKRFYVESIENRGGKDHVMYLWRDGKKLRGEMLMGLQLLKTFVDPDANKIVGIFDDSRQFVVIPYCRSLSGSSCGELVFDVIFSENAKFTPLVEEWVGKSMCKKYRVEAADDGAIWCWIDKVSGIPVKLSDVDGKHVVYWRGFCSNISLANIFTIPAGYSEKKAAD